MLYIKIPRYSIHETNTRVNTARLDRLAVSLSVCVLLTRTAAIGIRKGRQARLFACSHFDIALGAQTTSLRVQRHTRHTPAARDRKIRARAQVRHTTSAIYICTTTFCGKTLSETFPITSTASIRCARVFVCFYRVLRKSCVYVAYSKWKECDFVDTHIVVIEFF